jgi:hypothetical protein
VLHLAGQYPLGGIGWQAIHYVAGLARLGHDVYYVEDSGAPPYDPRRKSVAEDCGYSVRFLRETMERFGFGDRWAYRDVAAGRCYGLPAARVAALYREADALFNVCGATRLSEEHVRCPVRVYVQTDPVHDQLQLLADNPGTRTALADHTHHFTYGENLGAPDCPVPLGEFRWRPTRPPVVLDLWPVRYDPAAACFTTVGTWKNVGKDIRFAGEQYFWSKHVNFLRVLDPPRRVAQPFELALDSGDEATADLLRQNGWRVADAYARSRDTAAYQAHVERSRGEFTVAKDLVVRTRSGWFSDRSVCYLAAGKPVVTQDTGFGKFVPTGRGLFGFSTVEEAAAAIGEINRDYADHCRAARDIAADCFGSDRVLRELCREVGL